MLIQFNKQCSSMTDEIQELKRKMAIYESNKHGRTRVTVDVLYSSNRGMRESIGDKINPDWDLYEVEVLKSSLNDYDRKQLEEEVNTGKERIHKLQEKIRTLQEERKESRHE